MTVMLSGARLFLVREVEAPSTRGNHRRSLRVTLPKYFFSSLFSLRGTSVLLTRLVQSFPGRLLKNSYADASRPQNCRTVAFSIEPTSENANP